MFIFVILAVVGGTVWCQSRDIEFINNRYIFPLDDPTKFMDDPTGNIIGGEVSTYGDHPYMCHINELFEGRWYFICGAVIYNRNTVLTAAHCVDGLPASVFRVRCGDWDLSATDGFEVTKPITAINVHPGWQNVGSLGFPNDLATMEVETPFDFNDYVRRIPIQKRRIPIPRDCTLIGWGRTSSDSNAISLQLREVTIRRRSNKFCQQTWGDLVTKSQICFLDKNQPDSSCNGDSGGPAVCGGYLVGVTSWGVRDCLQGYPSVYTRLIKYRRWIRQNDFRVSHAMPFISRVVVP